MRVCVCVCVGGGGGVTITDEEMLRLHAGTSVT